jgi:hypothetical protein
MAAQRTAQIAGHLKMKHGREQLLSKDPNDGLFSALTFLTISDHTR